MVLETTTTRRKSMYYADCMQCFRIVVILNLKGSTEMGWHFEAERVTQAAAHLVRCSGQDSMQYLKLLKLLYLADRESIRQKSYPITGDDVYAMDYGPVLSRVYDFINCAIRQGAHVWSRAFQTNGYTISLVNDPGVEDLSPYDLRILEEVYEAHKEMDGFELSQLSHAFPEWAQQYRGEGTSTKLPVAVILSALGFDDARIVGVEEGRKAELRYFEATGNLMNDAECPPGRLLSA